MNDADVAIRVVSEGAAVVRRLFGVTVERFDKGRGDFATTADVDAERAMLAVLHRERPQDAVSGEETGQSGAAVSSRTWFIDPLCGTLNYAAGMQVVAVNAAVSTQEAVLAAAVADPFADTVLWTDGDRAWLRSDGRDSPAVPSGSSRLVDLNLDPPFPNADSFRAASLAAEDGFTQRFRPRVVSSTLAVSWVATGQRAGYVTDGDLRGSVHFTAGVAICQAAGCTLSDLRGRPFGHGPDGLILAADPETHDALLELAQGQRA